MTMTDEYAKLSLFAGMLAAAADWHLGYTHFASTCLELNSRQVGAMEDGSASNGGSGQPDRTERGDVTGNARVGSNRTGIAKDRGSALRLMWPDHSEAFKDGLHRIVELITSFGGLGSKVFTVGSEPPFTSLVTFTLVISELLIN